MNTFYSVIFASINSIISERLSIGLVMINGNQVWYRYSKTKLSFMKQFFTDDAFLLLKASLKNIEIASTKVGLANKQKNNLLFEHEEHKQQVFSTEYLNYLSRYSNTILTFNEPVKIDIEAHDALFEHLYNEFVFVEIEETKKISTVETVKNKLYPSIEKRVNLDQSIETGQIPGLVIPVELDFIGKNEKPVIGKITDFNQPNYYLDASLGNIFVLMKALESNGSTGNYFIIGNEPDLQNEKQHKTWSEVRNSKFLSFVSHDETECITEYMEKHKVKPYFPIEL